MSNERFQVIVVGAGLAGCSAAYRLAKAGYAVLLIERGKAAGAKNVSGGRIYSYALEALMPGEWHDAPLERQVAREMLMLMTDEGAVTVNSLFSQELQAASYTVLRSKLDDWMRKKAEEAGAMVITGVSVTQIIMKGGKACGVLAGDEELEADIVICADGANSLLAAGFAGKVSTETAALGVKMVVGVPEQDIQDRFNLAKGQGAACLMVGGCTKGLAGGGFLYTNKESVSLGIVVDSAALKGSQVRVVDLIEQLPLHPAIAPLVKGGQLLEYSAHLIPEGGIGMLPTLYGDGFMIVGDAAGLVVNSGATVRGMDYAILSGIFAAETAGKSIAAENFSASELKHYEVMLRQQVIKDMKTFKNVHAFMKSTPGLYTTYPEMAESIFKNIFTVDGRPARRISKVILESVRRHCSFWQLIKDSIKGGSAL
ncbi:MAG: oxidoreductase FixC [Firmicutes bacterium]|nr:oxidoreductase FixC [Bacillota bacterium]